MASLGDKGLIKAIAGETALPAAARPKTSSR